MKMTSEHRDAWLKRFQAFMASGDTSHQFQLQDPSVVVAETRAEFHRLNPDVPFPCGTFEYLSDSGDVLASLDVTCYGAGWHGIDNSAKDTGVARRVVWRFPSGVEVWGTCGHGVGVVVVLGMRISFAIPADGMASGDPVPQSHSTCDDL